MEDTLENDDKGSIEKLNDIIDDLEAIHDGKKYPNVAFNELTSKLLSGFINLRKQNWGRLSRSASESSVQREIRPEHDENYFMVSFHSCFDQLSHQKAAAFNTWQSGLSVAAVLPEIVSVQPLLKLAFFRTSRCFLLRVGSSTPRPTQRTLTFTRDTWLLILSDFSRKRRPALNQALTR